MLVIFFAPAVDVNGHAACVHCAGHNPVKALKIEGYGRIYIQRKIFIAHGFPMKCYCQVQRSRAVRPRKYFACFGTRQLQASALTNMQACDFSSLHNNLGASARQTNAPDDSPANARSVVFDAGVAQEGFCSNYGVSTGLALEPRVISSPNKP